MRLPSCRLVFFFSICLAILEFVLDVDMTSLQVAVMYISSASRNETNGIWPPGIANQNKNLVPPLVVAALLAACALAAGNEKRERARPV